MQPDQEVARVALEKKLGFRLSEAEWDLVQEDGYDEEILRGLEGEPGFEDALDMTAGRVRRLRRIYGDAVLATDRLRVVTERDKAAPPVHDRALSLAIGHLASQEAEVKEFREEVLRGRLLALKDIKGWIEEQARRDGHPTTYLEVPLPAGTGVMPTGTGVILSPPLGLGDVPHGAFGVSVKILRYGLEEGGWAQAMPTAIGGTLDRLRHLSERLESVYGWKAAEASVFVLTGLPPLLADVRVHKKIRPMFLAASRIVLEVDPSVEPKRLAQVYGRLRKKWLGGRYRPLSPKHLRLAVFSLEQRGQGRPWNDLMRDWNESYGHEFPRGSYEHVSNLRRDAGKAQEHLLKGVLGPRLL